MTRMFHPPELERSRKRNQFDPIREGERYGLARELSLAIWERVCADATDTFGRCREDQARERFHELAARITARGGRLRPCPGRLTRVGIEMSSEPMDPWAADELVPRVPGRQTLAAVEARRWAKQAGDASAPVAREASGLVTRKVDEDRMRREPFGVSEVEQAMATLQAGRHEGDDALPVPMQVSPSARVDEWLTTHGLSTGEAAKPTASERQSPVGNRPILGLEPYLVAALKEVFKQLGPNYRLRQELIAATAKPAHSIAGTARWSDPLPSIPMTNGHVLWQVAERHAATLYRRAASSGAADPYDPVIESALQKRGTGQPLPTEIRREMELELGVSLAGVRLHTDAVAARAARALSAEAFTLGEDIFFAEGMFTPDTPSGRKLLAHELTHVVQALRGLTEVADAGLRVSEPGEPLEQEANRIAERIHDMSPARPIATPATKHTLGAPTSAGLLLRAPRTPEQTFTGKVFLPGSKYLGHQYEVHGDGLIERGTDGKTTEIAKLDRNGNYSLIAADGTVSATPDGKLVDLLGEIKKRGRPLVSFAGSGTFTIEDNVGQPHQLQIVGAGIYEGDKAARQLVGHVSATGHYEVWVADTVLTGDLTDLPAGSVRAQLERKQEGKITGSLEIGQQTIKSGKLALVSGNYVIKNDKVFPADKKNAVGTLSVISSGAEILKILYKYTDANGRVHTGDLLESYVKRQNAGTTSEAPLEGSTLYLGGGRREPLLVYADETFQSPGRPVKRGFENNGGGNLSAKLREMRTAGQIVISDDELDTLQRVADVESSGQVNSVNTWDDQIMTFGFMQWTLGNDELQDIIAAAPAPFAMWGIELDGSYTIHGKSVRGIKGVDDARELRGPVWASKFFNAGLEDDIIVAEVNAARQRLGKTAAQTARSPHLSSPRGRALLAELYNNRPAYVNGVVNATLREATPGMSEDDFIDLLVKKIEDAYDSKENDRAKAQHWTREVIGRP